MTVPDTDSSPTITVVNKRETRKMKLAKKVLLGIALSGTAIAGYAYSGSSSSTNRRSFLNKGAITAGAAVAGVAAGSNIINPNAALADDSDPYADYITTESGLKYKVR